MDDDDAALLAVPDIGEFTELAVEVDFAAVGAGRIDTGQHLHQGGFPGAVLPANGVDFPSTDGQADVLQGFDAREFLGDRPHLKNVVVVHGHTVLDEFLDWPPAVDRGCAPR